MYRTVTDLAYSRSPECPFIVDEVSMTKLRSRLSTYENEKTLVAPDAQIGVRKSIAAALGGRKGFTQEGEAYAIVHPCSVDLERLVEDLCGPRLQPENIAHEQYGGSGTMSMDLGTDYETPQTPPDMQPLLKVVGSKVCEEVLGARRVDDSPGGHLWRGFGR